MARKELSALNVHDAVAPEATVEAPHPTGLRAEHLARSFNLLMEAIDTVEDDWTPRSLSPKGEPQLGRRGLYGAIGGTGAGSAMPMLWVLNLADGTNSLLDMAERSGLHIREIRKTAQLLREHGLLEPA